MSSRSVAHGVVQLRAGVAGLGVCLTLALAAPGVGVAADVPASTVQQKAFKSPEEAAEALFAAAESFDVEALTEIFGPDGADLVVTEDR